jgi:hypothetical protein
MVFTKILNIATSLFYFTNNYKGQNLRKMHPIEPSSAKRDQELDLPTHQNIPPSNYGIATDYIPINERDTFFISYHNNIRKDVRYKNGIFEDVILNN